MAERRSLPKIIEALADHYGKPDPPSVTDPFELILLENVAYLVSDQRRQKTFETLRERVGLKPIDILSASHERLLDVTRLGGMHPEQRVERLKKIAEIALEEFGGDLQKIVTRGAATAKRELKKFPSIGDPGAEKILLFSRAREVLALDSNGLRVLLRLGFGEERKSYGSTYRAVQEAVEDQLKDDIDWLISAHQLLRQHGQQLCKNAEPWCAACPVKGYCRYYEQHTRKKPRDADID
jgi:endonuclease-3